MSAREIAILLALLLVAWLTAAATAVRSVSRIWLRHWVEGQLSGSVTAEAYLERLHQLLLAAGAGVALVVALAGTLLGWAHAADGWLLVLQVIAVALAMLVAGQLVPRAIARRWATRLIPVLLPPLRGTALLLAPLARAAAAIARAVTPRATAASEEARDGIEDLLREGELEGIGERDEIEIITGVVEFGEKTLRDVMTPRTNVFAVDIALSPTEMARAIAQSGYSRVPVYRGSLDEIIGMVHVFDVLIEGGEQMPPIRPVGHAPATKRCSQMLFEMLRGQRHLAVVLDEYGGTAGIVTLEDVLEELVGDIHDEHDEPVPPDTGPARCAMVLDATTPLDEVATRFDVALPAERAQTLGGAVVRLLGRIPVVGERFTMGGLELTVVEATPARPERLLVQRADAAHVVELAPGVRPPR